MPFVGVTRCPESLQLRAGAAKSHSLALLHAAVCTVPNKLRPSGQCTTIFFLLLALAFAWSKKRA